MPSEVVQAGPMSNGEIQSMLSEGIQVGPVRSGEVHSMFSEDIVACQTHPVLAK